MPYSPIPKFPDIMRELKAKGYRKEVALGPLTIAIMNQTGSITDRTIKNIIRAMEQLEYLEIHQSGSFWLIKDKTKPKAEDETIHKEAQEIDKTLDLF